MSLNELGIIPSLRLDHARSVLTGKTKSCVNEENETAEKSEDCEKMEEMLKIQFVSKGKVDLKQNSQKILHAGSRVNCTLGFAVLLFGLMVQPSVARAACTNPAGDEGEVIYNADHRNIQFCDGTSWKGMLRRQASKAGDCTNPTRKEGAIIYNADLNMPQICIGGWHALGISNPGAGTGGCSSPSKDEGEFFYNPTHKVMQYCNGSQYVKMAGSGPVDPCPSATAPGQICTDGSVVAYADVTGNFKWFAARCDAGMTWNGTTCIGTRSNLPWNNGNSSNYTSTGATGTAVGTGRANTEILRLSDSDPSAEGQQYHRAAQACVDLVENDHSDWYLPSRDELNILYGNRAAIGNFDASGGAQYWSSSESNNANAWRQRQDGYQNHSSKQAFNFVRCIRK